MDGRRQYPRMYPVQPQQYQSSSPFAAQYTPVYDPAIMEMMSQNLDRTQQRHDKITESLATTQAMIGQTPITGEGDAEVINQALANFNEEEEKIAKQYNYDYSRATTALTKAIAKEAANPIYQLARHKAEQAKLEQQAVMQYGADALFPQGRVADKPLSANASAADYNAFVIKAPEYVKIMKDLIPNIPDSTLAQWGLSPTDIYSILTYGQKDGVKKETIQEVTNYLLNAFKDATPEREYDHRSGYEWVRDDEEIKRRLFDLARHQERSRTSRNFINEPTRRQGGVGGTKYRGQAASAVEATGASSIQGITDNIIDIDSLRKEIKNPNSTKAENALSNYQEIYQEVVSIEPELDINYQISTNPDATEGILGISKYITTKVFGEDSPDALTKNLNNFTRYLENISDGSINTQKEFREAIINYIIEEQTKILIEEFSQNPTAEEYKDLAEQLDGKRSSRERLNITNDYFNKKAETIHAEIVHGQHSSGASAAQVQIEGLDAMKVENRYRQINNLAKDFENAFKKIDEKVDERVKLGKVDAPIFTVNTDSDDARKRVRNTADYIKVIANYGVLDTDGKTSVNTKGDVSNAQLKIVEGKKSLLSEIIADKNNDKYDIQFKMGTAKNSATIKFLKIGGEPDHDYIELELVGTTIEQFRNMYRIASSVNSPEMYYAFTGAFVANNLAPYKKTGRKKDVAYDVPLTSIYGRGDVLKNYSIVKLGKEYRIVDINDKDLTPMILDGFGEFKTNDSTELGQYMDIFAIALGIESDFLKQSAYKNAQNRMSNSQLHDAFTELARSFEAQEPEE
jgi:hypothetical protein